MHVENDPQYFVWPLLAAMTAAYVWGLALIVSIDSLKWWPSKPQLQVFFKACFEVAFSNHQNSLTNLQKLQKRQMVSGTWCPSVFGSMWWWEGQQPQRGRWHMCLMSGPQWGCLAPSEGVLGPKRGSLECECGDMAFKSAWRFICPSLNLSLVLIEGPWFWLRVLVLIEGL